MAPLLHRAAIKPESVLQVGQYGTVCHTGTSLLPTALRAAQRAGI